MCFVLFALPLLPSPFLALGIQALAIISHPSLSAIISHPSFAGMIDGSWGWDASVMQGALQAAKLGGLDAK